MNNGPIHSYPFDLAVPEGDSRERHVCGDCGWIHYVNPKIVVGAVCLWEDKVLLCRRAIEPRHGYWTVPAGYMEENESTQAGAAREVWEEALAKVKIGALLGVYNIPRISQVHMMYRAEMESPEFGVGEETLEAALFEWDDIPWEDLAFPSVHWALQDFAKTRDLDQFQPFDSRL
jgi:ADP-ribose pyrophosphatase YjhB (NUDIX family)